MRIAVRFEEDVPVVSLSGKFLAGSDGPYLRQKVKDLIDAGSKGLVLNFSEVPYIDSTGLGFLAGSRVTAENAGVRMILASVNQHVRKVLDDVKLSQFFTISEDEAAALAQLKQACPPAQGSEPAPAKPPKGKKRSAPASGP